MQKEDSFSAELTLATLFLGLSPVYWLPGIPSSALLLGKLFFLALLLAYPFLYFRDGIYAVPRFMPALLFFSALIATPSALAHLNLDFAGLFAVSFFVTLGYTLACRHGLKGALNSLFFSSVFFSLIAILVVVDFVLSGYFFNPIHEVRLFLYQTGFHGGRTGWTAICNVFLAITFVGIVVSESNLKKTIFSLAVIVLILNLVVVDSRGGLITGIIVLAAYLGYLARTSKARAATLLIALLLLSLFIMVNFGERFLMSRTYLSIVAPEELRSGVTTGRTEGFIVALNMYLDSPVLGAGAVNLKDFGQDVEKVHNVWLRILAEQGLLGFLGFFIFSVGLSFYVLRSKNIPRAICAMFLASGFVPTLFEPTGVFGNYFATAPFWMMAGVLLASKNNFSFAQNK
ncbi:O-antigen ligase family protein [Thauera linaloolentis]|nr:O-antigen ligase family protein [Thauera linaloolentis]MCM8566168.1 O-antigen ligase family protein [Thauera linaloolentis]